MKNPIERIQPCTINGLNGLLIYGIFVIIPGEVGEISKEKMEYLLQILGAISTAHVENTAEMEKPVFTFSPELIKINSNGYKLLLNGVVVNEFGTYEPLDEKDERDFRGFYHTMELAHIQLFMALKSAYIPFFMEHIPVAFKIEDTIKYIRYIDFHIPPLNEVMKITRKLSRL
jgi:5-hydroxyisourate hydrolase-like protein (transthyretin family)